MDFIPAAIQRYCEEHSQAQADLLSTIERETHLEVLKPRMLSGHLQGRFLSMVSHMMRPNRILEIGTYTGYSALCLAEGLQEKGRLYTLEYNEEHVQRAGKYFNSSDFKGQISLIHGDAREVIPTLSETWDLIFIDADKDSYQTYFDLVLPYLRTGGFILLDNVLWSGKVTDERVQDSKTVMIRKLNRSLHDDPRVEEMILPFRDGITILRKL